MKEYGSRFRLMELIRNEKLEPLLDTIPGVKVLPGTGVPQKCNLAEKTLERYLKDNPPYCTEFDNWWIPNRGKRPTWDYICQADFGDKRSLILLEAKAHKSECSRAKKPEPVFDEPNHKDKLVNHNSIEKCISYELTLYGGSYEGYYQLANRVAYASFTSRVLEMPVLLVFLGFIGESWFKKDQFENEAEWHRQMEDHIGELKLCSLLQENPAFLRAAPIVTILSSKIK